MRALRCSVMSAGAPATKSWEGPLDDQISRPALRPHLKVRQHLCVTIAGMALYDQIQSDLVEARRRRDEVGLSTLSMLKSELVKASKETGAAGALDDELVKRVARKEVKRREEAIEAYRKAGREESAAREEAEMVVLRGYLPAAMSTEEVEAEVRAVIDELKPEGPKAFGAVMKAATARLAGRAEGNQVAAAARKLLGS